MRVRESEQRLSALCLARRIDHHVAPPLGGGVVKMNVDTGLQRAQAEEGYFQGKIGKPEGADKPNKSVCFPKSGSRRSFCGRTASTSET